MFRTLLLLFATAAASAQQLGTPQPISLDRTEQRTIVARSNGVAYKLYVALPHRYGETEKRYPVVYLLDADYSFLLARNIADHLAERNHLRELILVAIAYDGPPNYRINRTRDYTPLFAPDGGYGAEVQKVSGGGPKFRSFLEKELIPAIDRSYRTMPGERCLVGHSYGGLFATWTLLSTPSLFNRYVIVSPSLWYLDRWIMKFEEERARKSGKLTARVYMAAGDMEQSMMGSDLRELASTLRKRKHPGLEISADVLTAETHNSIFPRALSNGLRFVFEGR